MTTTIVGYIVAGFGFIVSVLVAAIGFFIARTLTMIDANQSKLFRSSSEIGKRVVRLETRCEDHHGPAKAVFGDRLSDMGEDGT